jgi:hypothetical protein
MNKMNHIDFSKNWNNKLDCQVFTTIRFNDTHQVGDTVLITLEGHVKGEASIIQKLRIENIDKVSEWIAYLDIGESKAYLTKLFENFYAKKFPNWRQKELYYYLIKFKK